MTTLDISIRLNISGPVEKFYQQNRSKVCDIIREELIGDTKLMDDSPISVESLLICDSGHVPEED